MFPAPLLSALSLLAPPALQETDGIDLSGDELDSLYQDGGADPGALQWFEKMSVWGYVAGAYFDSGSEGRYPDGAFLLKDAGLFLEAYPAEDWSAFFELQIRRTTSSANDEVEIGEAYLHGRNLLSGSGGIGLKVGRVDIPFGEEYLRFDSADNEYVSHSPAVPYGVDEGVLAHGSFDELGWIVAAMNGRAGTNVSEDPFKSYALKLHGRPTDDLYVSASAMTTGRVHASALKVSGFYVTPVGCYGSSAVGASPSNEVESYAWSLDGERGGTRPFRVIANVGQLYLDDDAASFDRDFLWFSLEPRYRINKDFYVALRYGEIGTYDSQEGYRFDGPFFGTPDDPTFTLQHYDTERLQRAAVVVGWTPTSNATFKFEVGKDRFDLIEASTIDPDNDDRFYFGFEAVLSF